MKSLNSFTGLPISKGLLLLVDDSVKEKLEALMLTYIEATKDTKSIDVIPLMRFLYEKMDMKGDDLKIAFCAVCNAKPGNFQLKNENEYYGQINFSAIEKKLFPLFEKGYIIKIKYMSPQELKEEQEAIEKMFNEPIEPYPVDETN